MDRVKAKHLLGKRLREEPQLLEGLLNPIIEMAISEAVRKAVWSSNRSVGITFTRARADDVSSIKASTCYTYVLPNGVLLGQAKRDDLLAGADEHERDAQGNMHKANWLRAIAKQIAGKCVSDALDEIAIGRLWEATK
jgi:hypothetical protein